MPKRTSHPETGTSLTIFLGSTQQQQIRSLQEIKDAMADVVIQAAAVDGSCCDKTVGCVTQIYMEANFKMQQLLNSQETNY